MIIRAVALFVVLSVAPVLAVDYVRLSPSEYADDLLKASELAYDQSYDEAIAILKVLVGDEPDNADALNLLGYSLRKTGDLDRAEGFYLKALSVDPEHRGANQYLGELYVERGNLEAARARLEVLDAVCSDQCDGRDALAAVISAASP